MKRNPWKGITRRTFHKFTVTQRRQGIIDGVFLWKVDSYGAWWPVAYIGETLGMDGVA